MSAIPITFTWNNDQSCLGRFPARRRAETIGKPPAVTVAFRLPPELKNEVYAYLKQQGISWAEFIQQALEKMK